MELKLHKHHITIVRDGDALTVKVIRLRDLGGVPRVLGLQLDSDIGFSEALKKLTNLTDLDDEMFIMMAEHTK